MLTELAHALNIVLLFITLFTGMLFYFRIARHLHIVQPTGDPGLAPIVRGGGVVFVLALLCWFSLYRLSFPWFMAGAMFVAAISYLHDLKRLSPVLRLVVHFIAFYMIIHQTGMAASEPWWIVAIIYIIGVGALNAYSFMDGINGMTGVYSLVNLITFYYVNNHILHFGHTSLIVFMIVAVVVFLYFNFREKARCLTGDVGSVTMGFVQLFLLLQLIADTGTYKWVLMFLVYGIDASATIVHRLWRKENIFAAHHKHLYQYLARYLNASPLIVALAYGLLQLLVNLFLVGLLITASTWASVAVIVGLFVVYVALRVVVVRRLGGKV